ncbi:MAG: nitronate monooxygenase [Rhodospirillales bacterium]|jgi:NAD(P)H-dependent flavin oxidoreductase YrpB (nitropropane dioxygenase family)|nr:nitronate monooxygenase [Rhodospirillales bacterium]
MVSSRFTRLVRCALPLQQAGMGANASPELGAAVPKADGLGRLGTSRGGMGRGVLKARPDQVKALPAQPFGVSFIAAPSHIDYPQQYARSGADVWGVLGSFELRGLWRHFLVWPPTTRRRHSHARLH